MIRDRKMYVAPTPYGLLTGAAHLQTLILPDDFPIADGFDQVGILVRKEADRLIVGYTFDLRRNTLTPETISNPHAGRKHIFRTWRVDGGSDEPVVMREAVAPDFGTDEDDTEE